MKIDALKQYIQLRDNLLKEKTALEARLHQIEKALGGGAVAVVKAAVAHKPSGVKSPNPKHVKNKLSLKEAVTQALAGQALTKHEILDGIKAIGYKFSTKNPTNSLNVLLYTGKTFQKVEGGKFSAIK